MRDALPKSPLSNESAVVNLDLSEGAGTHWVAFKKHGATVNYYDSYGNLPPPLEVTKYLKRGRYKAKEIYYNYTREQDFNTVWCGHLCLQFLLGNK